MNAHNICFFLWRNKKKYLYPYPLLSGAMIFFFVFPKKKLHNFIKVLIRIKDLDNTFSSKKYELFLISP